MNTITRVTKIKDCPSFVDFRPSSADLPDFRKYNLIYGWNGSGKTSFSRILRSFELQKSYYADPEVLSEFEFKLDNGDSISQADLTTFPNIRVFNKDFINESVFGAGGPEPIFFLGKESKEDKEKITQIENKLQGLKKECDSKKVLFDKTTISRDRILSEKARDIKNTLTTSRIDKYRNYERPNLEETIGRKSEEIKKANTEKLEEDRLAVLQKAIQETIKSKVSLLSVPDFDISEIVEEIKQVLQQTVTSQIIEVLKSDDIVSKWVEHGFTIHKDRELKTCAFCNQIIPQDRFLELENHFNEDYQKLIEKIYELKQKSRDKKINVVCLDASNLYDDLSSEYLSEKKEVEKITVTFNQNLDSIISAIEQKERSPFSKVSLNDLVEVKLDSFENINSIIAKHNKKSENFERQVDENKSILEMHYIAEFIESYNEIIGEIKTLETEYSYLIKTIDEQEQEIRDLKGKLISHHIPVEQMNKDLQHFLGRSDIQLTATDEQEGYQITRNGQVVKDDLSEGEKTALAIVYFLTKINEEGFDLEEGVVVIDDPISSLDSSTIFQAFGFIKESIKGAGQIIILTHHFDFFRQVKNWFSYCNKNEREYFMVMCKEENSTRKSSIVKIDKLLIDYESEYHFLFSVLYKFARKQEKHLEEMYPLPNIARKFLESFLAFRVPRMFGGQAREPVLLHRLGKIDFDPKKKARIHRFIETHSHPRYESGVQDFDMTILGETPDILNDLLELVEHEDKRHYDFLIESMIN